MTHPADNKDKTIGPIIGSLIIVLILVLGALYFWAQKLNFDEKRKYEEQRSSEINSIKEDLETTNIESLNRSIETLE